MIYPKKMIKETKKKLEKAIMFMFLSLGVGLIIFGISGFYSGFHNVDLSRNILKISYYENLSYDAYADQYNTKGETMSYDYAYILGLEYMQISLFSCIIGGILFGVSLRYFDEKLKKLQDILPHHK